MISRELHGDSGSEGSEESGIFSTGSSQESPRKEVRRPGLGRRAITQVNMRDRKNSYNHALAKSQENLVKISSDSGAEDVFEQESTSIEISSFPDGRKDTLYSQKICSNALRKRQARSQKWVDSFSRSSSLRWKLLNCWTK